MRWVLLGQLIRTGTVGNNSQIQLEPRKKISFQIQYIYYIKNVIQTLHIRYTVLILFSMSPNPTSDVSR